MVFISTDQIAYVAISHTNVIQVMTLSSGTILIHYENHMTASTENTKEERSPDFVFHSFSKNGKYLAALTDNKKLLVWCLSKNAIDCELSLPKRPTCLDFCHLENTIVTADKYGDVYRSSYGVQVRNQTKQPTLLLGHLSMVLSVRMTVADKFIITADRDEKIRVSSYPNAYVIRSYCLGHTKLVSCLALVENDFLLSASADNTIRLWKHVDGEEIFNYDATQAHKQEKFVISHLCYNDKYILVVGEGIGSNKYLLALQDAEAPLQQIEIESDNVTLSNCSQLNAKIKIEQYHERNFLTQLVKPIRVKRPIVITPEATINLESATKIQKITGNTEDLMEE